VKEDDEGFLNDTVGRFQVDRRPCQDEVFARGQTRGWTSEHTWKNAGGADKDVAFVTYRLFCDRT